MNLPPPHVLARLDALIVGQSIAANDDVESGVRSVGVEDDDDRSISSAAFGIESSATSFSDGQKASYKRRREGSDAATPSTRARRPRRAVNFDDFELDDEDGWD